MDEDFASNDVHCYARPIMHDVTSWEKFDKCMCKNVIVCPVCAYADICTYNPITECFDFTKSEDVEVSTSDMNAWLSYPHLKEYMILN